MRDASAGLEAATPGERVIVLAPVGRDAPLLCQVLHGARVASVACGDMDELARHLQDGAGALLLTEEALAPAALSDLVAALSEQPPWSDLPVVLLAGGEPLLPANAQAVAALRSIGTLTVLERPVRGLTLVTAVQAALQARRRQYEIRELVRSERAARQAAEAARQEAEVASQLKDEFLATLSHELRTPLSAILLWTRLLSHGRLEERKVQHALQAVERSAEAQSQLIEDLLDISRITSGKLHLSPREADLGPVVHSAVDVVRPAAEAKRIRLDVAVEPRAGLVWADPDRLQQVVWNLLSNAVKFTPPGGRVSIRLDRDDGHDHARIEVADTGQGISPQFLPHVFERFRQADATVHRLQGGLGIGLAISRQLIELQGGTIRVDSPGEGLGAVFTVELPLALAAGPVAEPGARADPRGADPAAARRPLVGIRVLLVEDDLDTREALACTLGEYGAEVTAVESAAAALDMVSAAGPGGRPHVLLSDLGLPAMDGYELLRRVRAMDAARGEPALPAAVITAYMRTDDRARALEVGFATHLTKPVEPEQLAAVVEQLARSGG